MNLKEFRDQFPGFRPNALCQTRDGKQLEVISWPYEDDEEILIKARVPLDLMTIGTYRISGDDPDLVTRIETTPTMEA